MAAEIRTPQRRQPEPTLAATRHADCTPGALHRGFDSKEVVYAALQTESLELLSTRAAQALPPVDTGANDSGRYTASAATGAFCNFSRTNPRDLGYCRFNDGVPGAVASAQGTHRGENRKPTRRSITKRQVQNIQETSP